MRLTVCLVRLGLAGLGCEHCFVWGWEVIWALARTLVSKQERHTVQDRRRRLLQVFDNVVCNFR